MGIFNSVSDTITAVAQPIIRTAQAADETLEMATGRIHRRAVADKIADKQYVQIETAKKLRTMQQELDQDEELAKIFSDLNDMFD